MIDPKEIADKVAKDCFDNNPHPVRMNEVTLSHWVEVGIWRYLAAKEGKSVLGVQLVGSLEREKA